MSATSALRDTAVGAWRLRELLGQALDPLGRRVEARRPSLLRRLSAIVDGGRASCKAARSASMRLRSLVGLGQFVGDHQRRHDGQTRVADLAELAAQRDDALVEVAGELLKMAPPGRPRRPCGTGGR